MAQAPPVLRQALTTNTAPVNPTNPGQIPVWTGTSWIFTTNLPGLMVTNLDSGDLLWTNDNGIYRPTAYPTNFLLDPTVADGATADAMVLNTSNELQNFDSHLFSLKNKNTNVFRVSYLGGIEIGKGVDTGWGSAGDGETIVSFRDVTLGEPNNNAFVMGILGAAGFNQYSQHSFSQTSDDIGWNHYVKWGSDNSQKVSLGLSMNAFAAVMNLNYSNTTRWQLNPTVADSGTAVAYFMDSANTLATADARILDIRNGGVPKAWVRYDGSLVTTGSVVTTVGITNNGTYQHSVGAFTGALFVSSNANGVAYWSTNVNNIGVTNLSVYNNVIFNGGAVSNFNRDLNWTNDGTILRQTVTNPPPPLRYGVAQGGTLSPFGGAMSSFWLATNVARGSVAFGSNVLNTGPWSSVLGGVLNWIGTNSEASVIGGGSNNVIYSNSPMCVIAGGDLNLINPGVVNATIGGGFDNAMAPGANQATIAGGFDNTIFDNADHATIGGGSANSVRQDYGTISGGRNNTVGVSGGPAHTDSVIAGGAGNQLQAGSLSFIGGGVGNLIGRSDASTPHLNSIVGGASNSIATASGATSSNSFIGGGWFNNIGSSASHMNVIAGGERNGTDSSVWAAIGGGYNNIVGGTAPAGAIAGGHFNQIASASNVFNAGGFSNVVNGADLAINVGGRLNIFGTSGDYGFSMGHSNNVNAFAAGTIGNRATNALTFAIDVAPNGDTTKTTFHSASNYFRAPVVIGAGGALITNVLTASAALTFTAVAAQTSQDQSITVTGTTTNDVVTLGIPFQVQGAGAINCNFSAFTSNDTVWVRMNNYSSATRSTNGVFKVMVTRF